MRFRGLDLNLLAVFDGLMQTHSVSATARQMNLSQPAMSAALARLRDYFGDPLLVSHGKRMHPTALPKACCLRCASASAGSRRCWPPRPLRSGDLAAQLPHRGVGLSGRRGDRPMQERLAIEAPGVRLKLSYPDENTGHLLDDGKVDLAINPSGWPPTTPPNCCSRERHVVVGWAGNPLMAAPLDEEAFLAAGHVSWHRGADQRLFRGPAYGAAGQDAAGGGGGGLFRDGALAAGQHAAHQRDA
jgi:DNA-binding transcriptional LysR family regulator